jgi:hypothetical protein
VTTTKKYCLEIEVREDKPGVVVMETITAALRAAGVPWLSVGCVRHPDEEIGRLVEERNALRAELDRFKAAVARGCRPILSQDNLIVGYKGDSFLDVGMLIANDDGTTTAIPPHDGSHKITQVDELPNIDMQITSSEITMKSRRLEHKDGTPKMWPQCFNGECEHPECNPRCCPYCGVAPEVGPQSTFAGPSAYRCPSCGKTSRLRRDGDRWWLQREENGQ